MKKHEIHNTMNKNKQTKKTEGGVKRITGRVRSARQMDQPPGPKATADSISISDERDEMRGMDFVNG